MATREQLIEANKKAVKSPNHGKHGKRKSTIAKEQARAMYEFEILKNLGAITKVQLRAILKEKNWRERIEAIKQLIGEKKILEGNPDAPLIVQISKTIAEKNGIAPNEE